VDFALLLLLNAVLFIRPAEIIPGLIGLPFYAVTLAACLVLSYASIARHVTSAPLSHQPITACVLGFAASAIASNIARFQITESIETLNMFTNILIYFFLLVSLVNTFKRLDRFLLWLALGAALVNAMAILDFNGNISLLNMNKYKESGRMSASGLFGDPNDMSFLLVQNMLSFLYFATKPGSSPLLRWIWLGPMVFLGYGLTLTQSRGGMLALLAGLGTYLVFRYGRRAIPVGIILLPVLLYVFGGRQVDFDAGEGSAQSRLHLWDTYWELFRTNPLLGIGCNNSLMYTHHVAHNSYIGAFAELGFFGGAMFLGAFAIAIWELWQVRPARVFHADPLLAHMLPFLAGSVTAYIVGMISLSRAYAIPTYNVLGLTVAYLAIVQTNPPVPRTRIDANCLGAIVMLGVVFLVAIRVMLFNYLSY
jgi:O-antigen ligase